MSNTDKDDLVYRLKTLEDIVSLISHGHVSSGTFLLLHKYKKKYELMPLDSCVDDLEKMKKENDKLKEALKYYAIHQDRCGTKLGYKDCDCYAYTARKVLKELENE